MPVGEADEVSEAIDRVGEPGVGGQRSEIRGARGLRPEIRDQRPEIRGPEIRDQRPEIRGQRSEV
jgi:hypothetical protein